MRDPHVESLHYKLVPDETTTFSPRAEPVAVATPGFTAQLADGAFKMVMLEHHPSAASARAAVEPYLNAWEVRHALSVGGQREFRAEFERAEIVDRDPAPPGTPQTIEGKATVHGRAVVSVKGSVERGSYPAPPSDFALDADALALWQRWEG